MRYIIILALGLFVSACAIDTWDRPQYSTFAMDGPNAFTMHVTDAIGLSDRVHMRWLEQYLSEHQMCVTGYRITATDIVPQGGALTPDEVTYRGVCE